MIRSLVLALVALFAISACNTISGAGEDLSSAGDAVTDTAQDTQDSM